MKLHNRWLSAARGTDWFSLSRHDDPDPAAPPGGGDPDPAPDPSGGGDPDPDPSGDDPLGDAGKRALQKEREAKAAAKKLAQAEKKRADDLARKVAEFEDRDKSELEKATTAAEAAAKRAEAATKRAVRAEVKAAAAEFADPDDAVAFLDLSAYTDTDGEIDTEQITADLADLLERKPHLKRQAPAPQQPKQPKPDPSQGPRTDPPPVDYRTASREDFTKELAKYGVRLRS
ncbi:hypothetical protein OG393_31005 [Streptomyces sp. NBC_01216]|uniref:hypothetical protein n=1 Tax=Streptomyces sp. NBC_01216 TaxID=2903778 RepID=UPI002E0F1205|nr:hypothetical protein OG393_31005 [Streptomyces sp. NBC_01216]